MGTGQVTLDRLKDQKKHEDSIEIVFKGNLVGRVQAVLQWIYSKVRFLDDVLKKWDETLAEDEVALHELEAKLHALRAPFESTLDAVVQSIGIEQQILLTHRIYPGMLDTYTAFRGIRHQGLLALHLVRYRHPCPTPNVSQGRLHVGTALAHVLALSQHLWRAPRKRPSAPRPREAARHAVGPGVGPRSRRAVGAHVRPSKGPHRS